MCAIDQNLKTLTQVVVSQMPSLYYSKSKQSLLTNSRGLKYTKQSNLVLLVLGDEERMEEMREYRERRRKGKQ
jgi:collagenase-like PrtC family protease